MCHKIIILVLLLTLSVQSYGELVTDVEMENLTVTACDMILMAYEHGYTMSKIQSIRLVEQSLRELSNQDAGMSNILGFILMSEPDNFNMDVCLKDMTERFQAKGMQREVDQVIFPILNRKHKRSF